MECQRLLKEAQTTGDLSLSIEDSIAAQRCGQQLWNCILQAQPLANNLRRSLRYCAAILYLMGSSLLAPAAVRTAYFQHHPNEGEKCVLLCLKVAKDYSQCSETHVAAELLSYASTVRDNCVWEQSKASQFDIEILFAQFTVCTDSKNWEAAVEKANAILSFPRLRQQQEESLLHLIYMAAEASPEGVTHEDHLRQLLFFSLQIQQKWLSERKHVMKAQILRGATCMQVAQSFLRCKLYGNALEYADAAHSELQSSESLVIRTVALASLQRTSEAVCSWADLSDLRTLTLDDLFSVAFVITEADPKSIPLLLSLFKGDRFQNITSDEFFFYFLSFLLRCSPASEVSAAVQAAFSASPDGPLAHAFLQLLWEYSQVDGLLCESRVDLLKAALHFQSAASAAEIECVVTSIGQIALEETQQAQDHNLLSTAVTLLRDYRPSCLGLFSKVMFCRLAYLAADEPAVIAQLHEMLEVHRGEDLSVACGMLVYFFIEYGSPSLSAEVSRVALANASKGDELKLGFFKIFALALLQLDTCSISDDDVSIIKDCAQMLTTTSLPSEDAKWWGKFLWSICDKIEGETPAAAIHLASVAIDLWIESDPESQVLLQRVLITIQLDFQLCATSSPCLAMERLQMYLSMASNRAQLNTLERCIIFLGRCEEALRLLQLNTIELSDCLSVVSHTNLLPNGCTFDDCDALCATLLAFAQSSDDCAPLRQCAVKVYLLAVSQLNVDSIAPIRVLRSLHQLFLSAPDVGLQNEICNSLISLLSLPQYSHDGSTQDGCSVATFIEFFSVEAWNMTVKFNTARNTSKMEVWRDVTKSLCFFLSDNTYTKSVIADFLQKMPILPVT